MRRRRRTPVTCSPSSDRSFLGAAMAAGRRRRWGGGRAAALCAGVGGELRIGGQAGGATGQQCGRRDEDRGELGGPTHADHTSDWRLGAQRDVAGVQVAVSSVKQVRATHAGCAPGRPRWRSAAPCPPTTTGARSSAHSSSSRSFSIERAEQARAALGEYPRQPRAARIVSTVAVSTRSGSAPEQSMTSARPPSRSRGVVHCGRAGQDQRRHLGVGEHLDVAVEVAGR